jgi:hypothetical protein
MLSSVEGFFRPPARLHGYYVTKQPGTGQDNISFNDAREQEMAYFRRKPWADQDALVQSRLGTKSLAQVLSELLSNYIADS